MAGLILAHLMDGVVDGIQVKLLGQRGQLLLAGGRAPLSLSAQLQVLLGGGGNNLAQQLGELGSMLGLFPGIALEGLGHFGVAIAVSLTAHGQVHANLGALAVEIHAKALDDAGVNTLGHAHTMLVRIGLLFAHELELALGSLALGAEFRSFGTFVNIAANLANPFHDQMTSLELKSESEGASLAPRL